MTLLEEIRRLYEEYFAEFQQLEQNRRLGAGAFGLSGGPRDYPCHQRFAGDLERLLQRAENIPSDEAAHILDYIWFAPQAREDRQDAVYWMLTAVHGMTAELAGRLSSPRAAQLLDRYQRAYPRREQLPVQKKVAAVLKKRAMA